MRLLSLLYLSGCVQGPPPLLEAHRAGTAYWPQNSRVAVQGSIDAGFDAMEVDLVLTKDLVPVLSHDPWVSEERCTSAAGEPLSERLLIRDLTLSELREGYLCGGIKDPEFPEAEVVEQRVLRFDEMLSALRAGGASYQIVHLDIKQEPGLTESPEVFAEAILGRWFEADLPQPFYVSSNLPEVLRAFQTYGASQGQEVRTTLIWPRFAPEASSTAVAFQREGAVLSGKEDYISLVHEAGADGIALQWELADRTLVGAAHQAGVDVQLWTLNDPDVMRYTARRWPVDVIITDDPRVSLEGW